MKKESRLQTSSNEEKAKKAGWCTAISLNPKNGTLSKGALKKLNRIHSTFSNLGIKHRSNRHSDGGCDIIIPESSLNVALDALNKKNIL